MIHKKSKLYNVRRKHPTAANKLKYRTISNLIHTMTRYETKKRAIDLSQSSTIKKFWSWVNSVKHHHASLSPLHSENTIITDDCAKADMFNKYFYSVFTDENASNLEALQSSLTFLSSVIQSVAFMPEDVYYELTSLGTSKACGPDHIIPKLSAEFISDPLSQLFNQSMSSETLPKDWTTANIVPIYKEGERCLVNNYRPISLTSIVVKVMEKVISRKLVTVLEKSGCIGNNQFGFRANRSTVTLLLSVIHDWSSCLDCRSTTHCVF